MDARRRGMVSRLAFRSTLAYLEGHELAGVLSGAGPAAAGASSGPTPSATAGAGEPRPAA
jgi:hypothetical protein